MTFLQMLDKLKPHELEVAAVSPLQAMIAMTCKTAHEPEMSPEQVNGWKWALHLHAKYQSLPGDEPVATALGRLRGEQPVEDASIAVAGLLKSRWPDTATRAETAVRLVNEAGWSWDPNDLAVSLTLWQRDDEARQIVCDLWTSRFFNLPPQGRRLPALIAAWYADVEEEEMTHQATFGPIPGETINGMLFVPYTVASRAGYRAALAA